MKSKHWPNPTNVAIEIYSNRIPYRHLNQTKTTTKRKEANIIQTPYSQILEHSMITKHVYVDMVMNVERMSS